jgi:membrane-bound serine protease (ClpP class)
MRPCADCGKRSRARGSRFHELGNLHLDRSEKAVNKSTVTDRGAPRTGNPGIPHSLRNVGYAKLCQPLLQHQKCRLRAALPTSREQRARYGAPLDSWHKEIFGLLLRGRRSHWSVILDFWHKEIFGLLAGLALLVSFCWTPACLAQPPRVVVIHLDDTIQPISADYLARGLDLAAAQHASAVLIEINTPGGLLDSMRQMVSKMIASPVPVIVYVAPSGSRAGSAGFFLLQAADVAAMAPGSNAGAAHPVVEGGKLDDIMKQKLENDTAAFLRSYVARRGRNVAAAEDAVRASKSYSDKEALQLNLIDVIAPDDATLLNTVDGRTITRFDGSKVVLHTRDAQLVAVNPTLREEILDRLTDPNLAVLVLVVGGLLIYVEFNTPGTIVPGTLGTILVLLALFALNLLPVRYTSVMLLAAAFVLLILEAKFASHGVLAAAGIVALVIGALTLVDGPIPELRVHLATALSTGLAFGLITVFLLRLALRARRSKVRMGGDAMIGQIAVVTLPLAPSGQVMVNGELWQAESATPAGRGEQVRVRGLRDLTLLVERVP